MTPRARQYYELYRQGVAIREIARQYGVGYYAVWLALRDAGLNLETERQQRALLLAALWRRGLSQSEIARRHGLPQTTVSRLVARVLCGEIEGRYQHNAAVRQARRTAVAS